MVIAPRSTTTRPASPSATVVSPSTSRDALPFPLPSPLARWWVLRGRWTVVAAAAGFTAVGLLATMFALDGSVWLKAVSVLVGVLALALLGWVTVLPSRVRYLTRTLGAELVARWHRVLGALALAATVIHVGFAVAARPRGLPLLNPFSTSPAALAGTGATAVMIGVCLTRRWGRRRGARYDRWQRLHVAGAVTVLALVGAHVVWLDRLITHPLIRAWLVVLGSVLAVVLLDRWIVRPLSGRGAYVLYGVRAETPSTYTLVLVPTPRGRLDDLQAGQFVWLRLRRPAIGVEEHPFTVASSAQRTSRIELTIRVAGDFTRHLVTLPLGARVWLEGPHGALGARTENATTVVMIAAGVGITPAISTLRTMAERADPRGCHLLVAGRPGDELFGPELDVLRRRLHLAVHHTRGERITPRLLARALPAPGIGVEYHVCGPTDLVTTVLRALMVTGAAPSTITTERFG